MYESRYEKINQSTDLRGAYQKAREIDKDLPVFEAPLDPLASTTMKAYQDAIISLARRVIELEHEWS
jgi:hypothetical protein